MIALVNQMLYGPFLFQKMLFQFPVVKFKRYFAQHKSIISRKGRVNRLFIRNMIDFLKMRAVRSILEAEVNMEPAVCTGAEPNVFGAGGDIKTSVSRLILAG